MKKGRFDKYGGQYTPETLMNALIELEKAYNFYKSDPVFNTELDQLLKNYAGRPSLLYFAKKMTKDLGGAKIYLKREDLNHTGSHKINNVLGQALLAKRWARQGLLPKQAQDSTAWQQQPPPHCWGWMRSFYGQEDTVRQALNVYRMELLGAKVHAVTSGTQTLKDAVNQTMREWTNRIDDTHIIS
jgi:tryptophan synthase beta chain